MSETKKVNHSMYGKKVKIIHFMVPKFIVKGQKALISKAKKKTKSYTKNNHKISETKKSKTFSEDAKLKISIVRNRYHYLCL